MPFESGNPDTVQQMPIVRTRNPFDAQPVCAPRINAVNAPTTGLMADGKVLMIQEKAHVFLFAVRWYVWHRGNLALFGTEEESRATVVVHTHLTTH
jgi:hypothetical protein